MIYIFADLLLPYITVKNEHECLHCKSEKKINIKKIFSKLVLMACVNKSVGIVKWDHGNGYVASTAYHFILEGTSKLTYSYI